MYLTSEKILSIGLDIQDISRFDKLIQDDKFLNKIFTSVEQKYCQSKGLLANQHYAARFAAKEAVRKAYSSSKLEIPKFNHIEIVNNTSGSPKVCLIKNHHKYKILISLSHSGNYAAAFVILMH
jgi:holo-[acyl-carrier protein] synthase